VLIVEDEQINRTILAKRMTLDGHAVETATNGQEGVEAILTDREYDCILMDIQMPILNGFEACRRIRALEAAAAGKASPTGSTKFAADDTEGGPRRSVQLNGGRIPIFAVSASLLERQRQEMLDYGMDGWILKPIDFRRLRLLMKSILDADERDRAVYYPGCSWEAGGWLKHPNSRQ